MAILQASPGPQGPADRRRPVSPGIPHTHHFPALCPGPTPEPARSHWLPRSCLGKSGDGHRHDLQQRPCFPSALARGTRIVHCSPFPSSSILRRLPPAACSSLSTQKASFRTGLLCAQTHAYLWRSRLRQEPPRRSGEPSRVDVAVLLAATQRAPVTLGGPHWPRAVPIRTQHTGALWEKLQAGNAAAASR